MPIYEYECTACGHRLEAIQKVGEPPLRDCPACAEPGLKRLISAAGFQLKGSGWYATDFKHGGKKQAESKDGENTKKNTEKNADKKPASSGDSNGAAAQKNKAQGGGNTRGSAG